MKFFNGAVSLSLIVAINSLCAADFIVEGINPLTIEKYKNDVAWEIKKNKLARIAAIGTGTALVGVALYWYFYNPKDFSSQEVVQLKQLADAATKESAKQAHQKIADAIDKVLPSSTIKLGKFSTIVGWIKKETTKLVPKLILGGLAAQTAAVANAQQQKIFADRDIHWFEHNQTKLTAALRAIIMHAAVLDPDVDILRAELHQDTQRIIMQLSPLIGEDGDIERFNVALQMLTNALSNNAKSVVTVDNIDLNLMLINTEANALVDHITRIIACMDYNIDQWREDAATQERAVQAENVVRVLTKATQDFSEQMTRCLPAYKNNHDVKTGLLSSVYNFSVVVEHSIATFSIIESN